MATEEKSTDPRITSSGKAYLPQASALITKCFHSDPAIRYMMCSLSDSARENYYPTYMHSLVKAAALSDATFEEANGWECCAVWIPPGRRVDHPWTMLQAGFVTCLVRLGVGGCKRMLIDFQSQSDAAKKRGLRDPASGKPIKRYHYLWFIATDPSVRGKGLATKLVVRYQRKAVEDGIPVWLEATTRHSRDIYERAGFEVVQEMVLGEGTHAESGVVEEGGKGVKLWAMIWRPPGMGESKGKAEET